jgi:hypothetical protein
VCRAILAAVALSALAGCPAKPGGGTAQQQQQQQQNTPGHNG